MKARLSHNNAAVGLTQALAEEKVGVLPVVPDLYYSGDKT